LLTAGSYKNGGVVKKIFLIDMQADENCPATISGFFSRSVKDSVSSKAEPEVALLEKAINELCRDIIKYGYKGRPGRILLKVTAEQGRISAVIIDGGAPRNIHEYDPISKKTKGIGGKPGSAMISKICDKIFYKRLNGKNRTTLVKYYGAKAAASAKKPRA
jgi:anti-sigma regulatory factor (Ser/Thr protein kinase)